MIGLDEIIGLEVISADARVIGTVEGIEIDAKSWTAPAIRIGLRHGLEELVGKKRRRFAVERSFLRTAEVASVSDTVILKGHLEQLPLAITGPDNGTVGAGTIIGMRVICSNARYLGMVDNMIFEPANGWTIVLIQVKLDRNAIEAMNLDRQKPIPHLTFVHTSDIRAVGDMIMLAIAFEDVNTRIQNGEPPLKD